MCRIDFCSNSPDMSLPPLFAENLIGMQSLSKEVVTVLTWLCEKLTTAQMGSSGMFPQSTIPLLLDGVLAILCKVPKSIQDLPEFVDLVW